MQKILSKTLPTGCSAPPQRWQRRLASRLALCGLASLAAGWIGSAQAGEHVYDFNPPNGDPYKNGFVLFGSNTNGWQTNGGFTGVDGDGFLEITPAVNGQNLGILFPLDYFTNADSSLVALPLKGFHIDMDVRTGNATGNNGRPADGFSISFASTLDPVVHWGKLGQFRGWGGGDSAAEALQPSTFNYVTGVGSFDSSYDQDGASTAENGTKTGVSVQFDTWQGNTIIDQTGTVPAAGNDNVGWRVHYNGKMINRILSQPLVNGAYVPLAAAATPVGDGNDINGLYACPATNAPADWAQDPSCEPAVSTDIYSIETGPYLNDGGSFTNLAWVTLSIDLTTNTPHLLTVTYKGRKLVDGVALTNFSPYVGQLVMGGRTGGANENRDIDNVHIITYPFVASVYSGISSASSYLDDFTVSFQNIGPAKVNGITAFTLDGVDIKSAALVTLGDPISTVKYTSPTHLPSGTAHSFVLTWTDAAGNTQTQNGGFTTVSWAYVPASDAVPAASIDKSLPGFLVTPSQVRSGEPNRVYWAQEQLQGLHGTNTIDFSSIPGPGYVTNGNQVTLVDVVNFGNGTTGSTGQFGSDDQWGTFGIPGLVDGVPLGNDDNSAAAFTAYLYFPTPGTYILGGNSDDGLLVTFAKNAQDVLGTAVPGLLADVGRGIGNDQNLGAVVITNAGYYGFRMLWFNGGGGSSVEWYTTQTPAGVTNVLINDVVNNPNQTVQAYQVSSAAPPFVSYAEPPLLDDQVLADTTLTYKLTDASTTVNSSSVALKVNGATTSPTVTAAGGVTTITLLPPPALWPVGTNTVELSFKDSAGTNYDYQYTFSVIPFVTLDPSLSVPLGSEDTTQPGFVLHVSQIDFGQTGQTGFGAPNQVDSMIALLAGTYFPWYGHNAADVANAYGTNVPAVASNMWYWTKPVDINIANGRPASDFTNDFQMPGIPGVFGTNNLGNGNPLNNLAAQFQAWIPFASAGYYRMGVNSDDGFRVFEGWGPTRQVLHVTGTGIDTDVAAVVSSTQYGNGGFAVPPPVVPITAPVFLVTSNNYTVGQPLNLSNKIAAITRGFQGLNSGGVCYFAATNGALAAIVINRPGDGFPSVMTAAPPAPPGIPCMNVNGENGQLAFWTNANLTASIGASQGVILGSADFGKGTDERDFAFYVPQAGVYPLTLVFYQGGGGAAVEWSQIQRDTTRLLVNDGTNPNSLQAFRAVKGVVGGPHTVSVSKSGSTVTITFTGTLFSSGTVNGTYTAVPNATSPYTVPSTAGAAFYRAH